MSLERDRRSGESMRSMNLGQVLFVLTSFVAPIEILLVGSFTVYDLLVTALFLLVLLLGRLPLPSPGILASGIVFLLFALLSTLRAPHPSESLTQIFQYLFIFFVQFPVILTFARTRSVIFASLFAFALGSLVTIVPVYFSPEQVWSQRVGGYFVESPNRLGYPTAYLAPLVCYFVLERMRSGGVRVLDLLGAGVVVYLLLWALAASGSRGATAGTLVSVTIFLAFRRGLSIRPATVLRIASALLTVMLCGALLYRSGYFPETLGDRISRTLASEEGLVRDRTMLAIAGLRAFAESPVLGVGLDNFRYVGDRYVPTITPQNPHNLWIQLLANTGLFGALAFLGIMVTWYGIMLRAQREHWAAAERELIWAFIAAMCSIMTIVMFIPVLIHRPYWWIAGMGLAVASEWAKADTRVTTIAQTEVPGS